MYGDHSNSYDKDGGAELSQNPVVGAVERVSGRISMRLLTATMPTHGDGRIKREVRETVRQVFNTADGLSDAGENPELSLFDDHRAGNKPLSGRLKIANGVAAMMVVGGMGFVGYEVAELSATLKEAQTSAEQQDPAQWLENVRLGNPDFARVGVYEYEPGSITDLPTLPGEGYRYDYFGVIPS